VSDEHEHPQQVVKKMLLDLLHGDITVDEIDFPWHVAFTVETPQTEGIVLVVRGEKVMVTIT
jgi:hypothetical protein